MWAFSTCGADSPVHVSKSVEGRGCTRGGRGGAQRGRGGAQRGGWVGWRHLEDICCAAPPPPHAPLLLKGTRLSCRCSVRAHDADTTCRRQHVPPHAHPAQVARVCREPLGLPRCACALRRIAALNIEGHERLWVRRGAVLHRAAHARIIVCHHLGEVRLGLGLGLGPGSWLGLWL